MNTIASTAGSLPPASVGDVPIAHTSAPPTSGEFDQWMDGLTASSPPRPPSMLGSMLRVPSAVSNQVMASVVAPPPPGMSLEQTMVYAAQKNIDVSNMKTLNNLVEAAAKLTRKTVETVLNNK